MSVRRPPGSSVDVDVSGKGTSRCDAMGKYISPVQRSVRPPSDACCVQLRTGHRSAESGHLPRQAMPQLADAGVLRTGEGGGSRSEKPRGRRTLRRVATRPWGSPVPRFSSACSRSESDLEEPTPDEERTRADPEPRERDPGVVRVTPPGDGERDDRGAEHDGQPDIAFGVRRVAPPPATHRISMPRPRPRKPACAPRRAWVVDEGCDEALSRTGTRHRTLRWRRRIRAV